MYLKSELNVAQARRKVCYKHFIETPFIMPISLLRGKNFLIARIGGSLPPLSLYSDLPRKFCFDKTTEAPAFIQAEAHAGKLLRKNPRMTFQRITLN